MSFFNLIYKRLYKVIAITGIAFLLAGCPGLLPQQTISDDASSPSSFYLDKAEQNSGSAKVDYQILAARALLREGNTPASEQLLNSLQQLNDYQIKEKALLTAEISVAKRNYSAARNVLNQLTVNTLDKNQQARYYQVQIAAADKQDVLTQLRGYVMLEQVTTSPEKHQDAIDGSWNVLSSLSATTLNKLVIREDENTLRGWLDLTRIYAANRTELSKLQTEIANWQAQYPQNPYNKTLPTRLAGLLQFSTLNVSQVALLLPLNGQAQQFSKAIKAGFEAGMKASQASNVQLTIYDTTTQPVAELLAQLEAANTPVIVGPLLKPDVSQLINSKPTLTVLALNKPDTVVNLNNVCYFALAPEDEAREAANYIAKNQHKAPLIIAPRNEFGQRVAKAFDEQWSNMNGTGAVVQYFGNTASLTESMNRRSGIRLTGSPVTSGAAVSSSSVDAVYIVATQAELTLIKAMIDMEAGNRVRPSSMYASSRSNNSAAGPDFRLEMDGIRFSEIPLLSGADNKAYQAAAKDFSSDYSQLRLYAFGMDAWKLVNSFAEIRQLPNHKINGYTGALTANNDCVINRNLSWLEYRQGSIVIAN